MEAKGRPVQNDCSFSGVSPLMLPFPYPPMKVQEQNQFYANLLTMDYCGSVSELTAITQYIHGESCMCCEHCAQAKTLIGIAMAEMMHLQKLAELIILLGGSINFSVPTRNGRPQMWTPEYVNMTSGMSGIISSNIEAERAAISQYEQHMRMIEDSCVNAVLARIVQDEEYHIMLLQMMQR
ncbi:MAG: rubrerythrin family protein [Lachnospiraceae bacterium]|nr:rubrerythrin family protein [Lachnospiraceae bacterium]